MKQSRDVPMEERARRDVSVATVTAKADLLLSELSDVVEQMASMLRDSLPRSEERVDG